MSQGNFRKFFLVGISCFLFLVCALALSQDVVNSEGSEERLKDGPIRDSLGDPVNREITVYESGRNDVHVNSGDYSRMRFYIAPLLWMKPYSETEVYKRIELPDINLVRYTFKMQNYASAFSREATRIVSEHYSSQTDGYAFADAQVNHMEHGKVIITPNLPEEIRGEVKVATIPIEPDAPINRKVFLQPEEQFSIYVPQHIDGTFKLLVEEGLEFHFTIFFNVKDIQVLDLTWNSEDIRETTSYKNLESGGAEYVTAEQNEEIVREVVRKQNVVGYIDPGMDKRIEEYAFELFNKLVDENVELALKSFEQAEAIDAQLRAGTNLQADDFQPITLMWQVQEKIKEAENVEEANKNIKEFYEKNRDKVNSTRERFKETELKVQAKAGWGPFSASVGYSEKNRTHDTKAEENLDERMDKGYFEDENSFQKSQESIREAEGTEVEIVGRGLTLIEKSTFISNLDQLAGILFLVPENKAASFETTDSVPTSTDVENYDDSDLRPSSEGFRGVISSPKDQSLLLTLAEHRGFIKSVAISPNGNLLASGSQDNTIKLWSLPDGRLQRTLDEHSKDILSIAFSPNGETLASGSQDDTIKLWNVSNGKLQHTLEGHNDDVLSVTFSPDSKTLISGSRNNTIKSWNVIDGRLEGTFEGQGTSDGNTSYLSVVSLDTDSATLATNDYNNTIKLLKLADGKLKHSLKGHTNDILSIAFSSKGQLLASGSADNTIRLWRVADGTFRRALNEHKGYILSLAFSPDGQTLASGSADNTIKLWSISDGKLQRTLKGHDDDVMSVAFSPDGKTLVSGSADNTIKLWSVSDDS